jgi:Ran GTPase-activating protein (RanGAP) involved in mRNA processing and transport
MHVLWKQSDKDFLQLLAKATESGWAGPRALECCECKWRSNDVLRLQNIVSATQWPIQRLNLSHNMLQNTGCVYLASAFGSMPSLQRLSIIGCHIRGEGVWELMPALTLLPQLEVLEIGFNPIGEGIMYICENLPHLTSLMTLDLTHLEEPFARGGLLEDGAMDLANALPLCPRLSRLHVAHNFMGPRGVLALLTAAQASSSLTELDVRGNHHAHAQQELTRVVQKTRCRVLI